MKITTSPVELQQPKLKTKSRMFLLTIQKLVKKGSILERAEKEEPIQGDLSMDDLQLNEAEVKERTKVGEGSSDKDVDSIDRIYDTHEEMLATFSTLRKNGKTEAKKYFSHIGDFLSSRLRHFGLSHSSFEIRT